MSEAWFGIQQQRPNGTEVTFNEVFAKRLWTLLTFNEFSAIQVAAAAAS
jgi:hypothetical protein